MGINKLFLTDFRNYSKKSWEFDGQTNLIVGPNASGKTNILEAIYALATGDSWRTETVRDMIRFTAPAAHIVGGGLHLIFTPGFVAGKRAAATLYKVDEVPRRRLDFVGRLKVVLFEPESLEIVIGDPSFRRRFLDEALSQTDRDYARSLHSYTKALRIRNKLLDAIRDGRSRQETLEFWERTLVKHGELIQDRRQQLLDWLADNSYKDYKSYNEQGITLKYLPNVINADRLDKYRDREILAGFTFVGPQRDDVVIAKEEGRGQKEEGRPLAQFGSRGEQRMAVLQLKLLQARWIEDQSQESPILLLDDIFSELDQDREKLVGELVKGRQTIMTATEIHKGHYPEAKVLELT